MNSFCSSRRTGFSLLELLVACALSILIVSVIVTMASDSLNIFRTTGNRLRANSDASVALDLIALDLQAFASQNSPFESMHCTPLEAIEQGHGHWLMFLSVPDDEAADPGKTRAISYKLAFQDVLTGGSGEPGYGLYRFAASSAETFAHAVGLRDLLADYWSSRATLATARENCLIGNVVCFGIVFSYLDENGVHTYVPEDQELSVRGGQLYIDGDRIESATGLLAEVSLTILSEAGLYQLRQSPDRSSEILARNSSTFCRTIPLN